MRCYLKRMRSLIFILALSYGYSEDITDQVFAKDMCCPAAFGHFNRDKLTDTFMITKKGENHIASVLIANENPPILRPEGPSCKFDKPIVSVVPADFDGDGDMDTFVLTFHDKLYKGYILWGNSTHWTCPTSRNASLTFSSQPLLMDYNGDMIADLFGENEKKERVFYIFSSSRNEPPIQIKMNPNRDVELKALSNANGHSFLDLDNDFAADLWLTSESEFEFWSSSELYTEYEIIPFPKQSGDFYGQNIFADFNLDGKLELLLPVCSGDDCTLYVNELNQDKKWYQMKINLTAPSGEKWKFRNQQSSYLYTNTLYPRVGDLDLDGFPDLLLTMFNSAGNPQVFLLENIKCLGNCTYSRTFRPNWNMLKGYGTSVLGTFFDFNEDGALDVLLVNTSSDGRHNRMVAYKNPIEYDATFLKVIVLTGKCYRNCSMGISPHGTNQPGPSVSYSIITVDGDFQKSRSTQLSQSSHFALQLPYTVFGLGRNWNFVDKLSVGLPGYIEPHINNTSKAITSNVYERTFLQIIPNSQVVVIPFPIWDSNRWIHKLFITPSTAMILTACSLILICLIVGGIIVGLHYFEKREDQKERLQEAQRFHFVAM